MTIRDSRARARMEHAARPASYGESYYGPILADLSRGARRRRAMRRPWVRFVILAIVAIVVIAVICA